VRRLDTTHTSRPSLSLLLTLLDRDLPPSPPSSYPLSLPSSFLLPYRRQLEALVEEGMEGRAQAGREEGGPAARLAVYQTLPVVLPEEEEAREAIREAAREVLERDVRILVDAILEGRRGEGLEGEGGEGEREGGREGEGREGGGGVTADGVRDKTRVAVRAYLAAISPLSPPASPPPSHASPSKTIEPVAPAAKGRLSPPPSSSSSPPSWRSAEAAEGEEGGRGAGRRQRVSVGHFRVLPEERWGGREEGREGGREGGREKRREQKH
jgi:hypothetical protein